jgi:hypothetical protein
MQNYFLLLFAFLGFFGSRAAAQHIPDANFAAGIRSQCPACIDANDSLTASAATLTYLDVSHGQISNLTGIEYFTSLVSFHCEDNQLTILPTLPPTLQTLLCFNNQLAALPPLPATLQFLYCNNNQLPALPTLPAGLQVLHCSANQLITLPPLPATLQNLLCDHNQLTALPTLPIGLQVLNCSANELTFLPSLPTMMWVLNCSVNQITVLPTLPSVLENLSCYSNQLITLPALPATLEFLDCGNNQLTALPTLPTLLNYLSCSNNPLVNLLVLPNSLLYLHLHNVSTLYCLPLLPNGLRSLFINNTNIQCLPNIPSGLSTTLPICAANNPNGCSTYTNFSGHTYIDFNNNCTYESGTDSILPNTLVVITTSNNDTFSIYSNAQGFYSIQMPDSLVVSSQIFPSPAMLYNSCPASIDTITPSSAVRYLGAQPTIFVPIMEVDIEAVLLRRCFASHYVVQYSNIGTIGATNAYVDIEFDSYLAYVSNSANLAATALGNNTYRFDLGDVGQGASGNFSITVDVSCDAVLGQVHCTNAHIYPDLTASLANWSGPVIEITDTCLTDSVLFQITNTGGAMSTTQTYQIIEDNLMYRPATPFLLSAGQTVDVVVPAQEGKIYRIEATQAAGFPAVLGDDFAWAVVQNCNGISSTSVNFVQQFFTNYGNLSQDNDCEANRGAYDPNDKNAQILGYGTQNCIAANTNLDYKIRFQNTGTDTAFRVFILDTLSVNVLDINTIRMGASSHNYTWELLDNNVLRFVFDDIRLVDSFTNEPLSNGFISFSIDQKADLSVGSRIENSAAIYFDFNAPVITNTAMHTICADFVLLGNTELLQENVNISAAPNPFDNQTIIKVSSAQNTPLSLQLYDATGRMVRQLDSQNNQFELMRNDLPSGVYFYQIFSAQQPLGRGKLIAK